MVSAVLVGWTGIGDTGIHTDGFSLIALSLGCSMEVHRLQDMGQCFWKNPDWQFK